VTVTPPTGPAAAVRVPLKTIAAQWARIGCIGFGGPPAHIHLLPRLCVSERAWLSENEFEDGIAATNLLPGPASTQLAIFCAWRLRGMAGALLGGVCFIVPGLIAILALAALFLGSPPQWVAGAAAGAGSAVAAVAVHAAIGLMPASRARTATPAARMRWIVYLLAGTGAGASASPYLVGVLLGCGLVEVAARRPPGAGHPGLVWAGALITPATGGPGALTWVALKVGLLSYGGGFVIIPLTRTDAVHTYHWMSDAQFLNAVALGQITPGPVVQTVAVVGYAAAGLGGGLLAALVAFTPSFAFVLLGAPHFERLRANATAAAFLTGAGPAVIGAIAGSAVPLAAALSRPWQLGLLAGAAGWLLVLGRGVVSALLITGVLGAIAVAWLGFPVAT
jgi:chromate transporter